MKSEIQTVREITTEPAIVHCSTIVVTTSGDLLCVWYEGPYETSCETVLKIARKGCTESCWSDAETLFDFSGLPLGNPVMWRADHSDIHIIFPVLLEESWTESLLFYSRSSDNGYSWMPPTLFLSQKGFMPKNRPIFVQKTGLLVPLYHEADCCPFVMIVDDITSPLKGTLIAETMARGKAIQPALLYLEGDTLLMLTRTNQGTIWKSLSYNRGLSWTIFQPTALLNPDSAIDIGRLQTGEIFLVFNNSATNRQTLAVALSDDNAHSWIALRKIVSGDGEYSYPSLFITDERDIHITYTENRYKICHAVLDRDWMLEKRLKVPIVTDKRRL
jgi:predicted neuraminidase